MSRTSIKPIMESWRKFLNESLETKSLDWWKKEWNLFADNLRFKYPKLFFSGVISNYSKMAEYEGFEKYSHDFFIRILYLIQKNYPNEFMESISGTSISLPLIDSSGISYEVKTQQPVSNSDEEIVTPKESPEEKEVNILDNKDEKVIPDLSNLKNKKDNKKDKYNFDKTWWNNSLKIFMIKMRKDFPHMIKSEIVQSAMKQSEVEGVGKYSKYSHEYFVRMLQIIQSVFPEEYAILRKTADIPADLFTIKRKPRAKKEEK